MSLNWSNSISQSCSFERMNNIQDYIEIKDNIKVSPIDVFYKALRGVLAVAEPTFLDTNKSIGPLLLVGIISITENYYRDILSRVIEYCPIAQACSAEKSINLGSAIWHNGENVERGTFENISFAGAESIVSTCRNYLKYEINKQSLTYAILQEYDKVCEFRHSIVHSGSIMAGKNAIKLGVSPCDKTIYVKVGYNQLQECASICTTLVVSFNIELFQLMCKRWAIDWRLKPSWNHAKRNDVFNEIWKSFYSYIDDVNGAIDEKLSMIKCRNQVMREFDII